RPCCRSPRAHPIRSERERSPFAHVSHTALTGRGGVVALSFREESWARPGRGVSSTSVRQPDGRPALGGDRPDFGHFSRAAGLRSRLVSVSHLFALALVLPRETKPKQRSRRKAGIFVSWTVQPRNCRTAEFGAEVAWSGRHGSPCFEKRYRRGSGHRGGRCRGPRIGVAHARARSPDAKGAEDRFGIADDALVTARLRRAPEAGVRGPEAARR